MRAPLAILLVVLLALPATSALPLPPPTAPPAAHATFDRTAYRAQVDKAVQFALGYQKPDGGVYEYAFLLKDQDASLALKLLAGSETLPVRGSNLSALIHYFESVQGVDGSFGSGSTVPTVTTQAIDGLLDAGYDQGSTVMTRALNYVRLSQGVDGSWSDGGSPASHQTAFDVEVLLRAGTARDDARLQQAIGFILSCQNGASGGFAPTTGFFETPAATADVIWGLDAYLRAPATGRETYTQAQVQAAVDAALGYLAAQLDPVTHYWQQNVGANAQIVGPVARYYAARDLAQPQWLLDGAQVLLDHQNAQGGLTYNSGSGVAVDWTFAAFAGVNEIARTLGSTDSMSVQTTVAQDGAYSAPTTSVTLVNDAGATVASASGPAGFLTLSWTSLPAGHYTARVASAGATTSSTTVWIG